MYLKKKKTCAMLLGAVFAREINNMASTTFMCLGCGFSTIHTDEFFKHVCTTSGENFHL